MLTAQKPQFLQILTGAMASYGKPLPEAGILAAWWSNLEQYSLRDVATALQAYCDEVGEFVPVPAGIAMRCKLLDGRPGPEEAWAISLTSSNEGDTVVWTAECAEAFALAKPILALGDEVGARMAFKEAYARLVTQARAERRPAAWCVSEGWDQVKRVAVVKRAITAGLLPVPQFVGLLAGPVGDTTPDENAHAQLVAIRKMLVDSTAERQQKLERAEQERKGDEMALDIEIQSKVDQRLGRAA